VNPLAGCHGCELLPNVKCVSTTLADKIFGLCELKKPAVKSIVSQHLRKFELSTDLCHQRREVAALIVGEIGNWKSQPGFRSERQRTEVVSRMIMDEHRCYAFQLHLRHGLDDNKPGKIVNSGYAPKFEQPTFFPGRVVAAANWCDLWKLPRPEKPWLDGLPRGIFVSDMGDALCDGVPFRLLLKELIEPVMSKEGQRHIWYWLTKRPKRMAEFSLWLESQGAVWPENLVAMTSVTSQKTAGRIDQLRRVNCRYRGLSVEPLWGPVTLDLFEIDWLIVGGESGGGAKPFDVDWARDLRDQCHLAGVAFFMKQLGAKPLESGVPLKLAHSHGGNWNEWPLDLRIREVPHAFREASWRHDLTEIAKNENSKKNA
jgi:protein gp37